MARASAFCIHHWLLGPERCIGTTTKSVEGQRVIVGLVFICEAVCKHCRGRKTMRSVRWPVKAE